MDKENRNWGIEVRVTEAIEEIQREFEISDKFMSRVLKEKASELNLPVKIVYCLPDGTELTSKEYKLLKKAFGKTVGITKRENNVKGKSNLR